jgi:hypothetical protein
MVRAANRAKSDDIIVFSIVRESSCAECGVALARGSFLRLEEDRPLCMTCADLDHLVFLPSGDAALTRRATKYSTLRAVVVRFSKARRRYERQGILVEESALDQAESECLADAEARAVRRDRAAARRALHDAEYESAFATRIGEIFPACPSDERQSIAEHACQIHSGRIGRTAAAKEFDASAVGLAVQAHVRHCHTPYDQLLASGLDRQDARLQVEDQVLAVLDSWRVAG